MKLTNAVAGDDQVGFPTPALIVFALLAIAGLQYVKWTPSYHRVRLIAAGGHMGPSILAAGGNPLTTSWQAAWSYAWAYSRDIWKALVLGLFLAAGVQALAPSRWLTRLLSGGGYSDVAAAGLLAVPSMMCTCCAAPVAVGLRKSGASIGATLAYWLGNPLLNPATLILIGVVLGWHWLALRLTVGVILVFGASYLLRNSAAREFAVDSASRAVAAAPADPPWSNQSVLQRWWKEFWRLALALCRSTCC